MYSFFELSGNPVARLAVAAIGSLIITAVLLASTVVPQGTVPATLTLGVIA